MHVKKRMLLIRFIQPTGWEIETVERETKGIHGHVLPYRRGVRSVRASYLKIVKADRDRFALAEGQPREREGRVVRSKRMALSTE